MTSDVRASQEHHQIILSHPDITMEPAMPPARQPVLTVTQHQCTIFIIIFLCLSSHHSHAFSLVMDIDPRQFNFSMILKFILILC